MSLSPDQISLAEIDRYKARAVELLKEAARIFRNQQPTAGELLDAGRSIAWAIRRANDFGFRHDIEHVLSETRAAAEAASQRAKAQPSWRDVLRQTLYS